MYELLTNSTRIFMTKNIRWAIIKSKNVVIKFKHDIIILENHSRWEYSGESELIILEYKEGILSFRTNDSQQLSLFDSFHALTAREQKIKIQGLTRFRDCR